MLIKSKKHTAECDIVDCCEFPTSIKDLTPIKSGISVSGSVQRDALSIMQVSCSLQL